MKLEISERYITEQQKTLKEINEILEKLGIRLCNEHGQYRKIEDIFEELAEKWKELNHVPAMCRIYLPNESCLLYKNLKQIIEKRRKNKWKTI